jgi:hypothetical protein
LGYGEEGVGIERRWWDVVMGVIQYLVEIEG